MLVLLFSWETHRVTLYKSCWEFFKLLISLPCLFPLIILGNIPPLLLVKKMSQNLIPLLKALQVSAEALPPVRIPATEFSSGMFNKHISYFTNFNSSKRNVARISQVIIATKWNLNLFQVFFNFEK